MAADVRIFGIRHHGPGSARTLVRALEAYEPDAVLIEGPPDADALIPLADDSEMEPPVALLVYESSEPGNASFYPFARFSPEWQALRFARDHGAMVRFMDLPVTHRIAMLRAKDEGSKETESRFETAMEETAERETDYAVQGDPESPTTGQPPPVRLDPLGHLARAAGFDDGERWWEHMFEHRRGEDGDPTEIFTAVLEAMAALREEVEMDGEADIEKGEFDAEREAFMRRAIRQATKEHERIAVVCGAWHAPALANIPPASTDNAVLKGLPKAKVEATWVPWTHRRLAAASGYGAGVRSPGWYDHLWSHEDAIAERWLTRVARLLRDEDLDASSAHVIESFRLAGALAVMRDRAIPGLDDLTEATEAVLCAGDPTPLALIEDRLIIGDTLGTVPDSAPTIPLQQDLAKTARRLRLKMSADEQDLDLDLRKPILLERSHLLHRLNLLSVPWGDAQDARSRASTFHELWRIQWHPEYAVRVIEAGAWGNTVPDAAAARVRAHAREASSIAELTTLVDHTLLADLPEAAGALVRAIEDRAAVDTDVRHLLAAFPPLARITRYGSVRKTDAEAVAVVLRGLATRFCVSLPPACRSLSEDAAAEMVPLIGEVHAAVSLAGEHVDTEAWHAALQRIAVDEQAAPGIGGRACRLLLDASILDIEAVETRLSVSLSQASEPARAAAWVDGFLAGSGLVLIHDERLFPILDAWVSSLSAEHFTEIVPILRRTFSTFAEAERRMLGERARRGAGAGSGHGQSDTPAGFAVERAERALGVIETILGRRPMSGTEARDEHAR